MSLPEDIEEVLRFVYGYAPRITDWLQLKKELVKTVPPSRRSLFSRRHPVTKQQQTNEFELSVMSRWEELTGNSVVFTKQDEEQET